MQVNRVFHEDVFYEHFRPFRHPEAGFDIWGGYGLETFGDDLRIVCDYPERFVWTVVEGGRGDDCWIITGFHFVNRICYLLTEIPHDSAPVEFRVMNRQNHLTQRGLSRSLSALRRVMSAQPL